MKNGKSPSISRLWFYTYRPYRRAAWHPVICFLRVLSVISASVINGNPAIEAAFSRAERVTLVGPMTPGHGRMRSLQAEIASGLLVDNR